MAKGCSGCGSYGSVGGYSSLGSGYGKGSSSSDFAAYGSMTKLQEKMEKWRDEYLNSKSATYPVFRINLSEIMPYKKIEDQKLPRTPFAYSPSNYQLPSNLMTPFFYQNNLGYSRKDNYSNHKNYN